MLQKSFFTSILIVLTAIVLVNLYSCKKQETIIPKPSTIATQRLVNTAIPLDTSATVYIGNQDSMYAINATTGKSRWVVPCKVGTTPTIEDGIVYVGSWDHNLYALDAATGALKWKYPTDDNVITTPIVYNNFVYIGSLDGNMHALDATTGAPKWKYSIGFAPIDPTRVFGTLFIGSLHGDVAAINAFTGKQVWRIKTKEVSENPTFDFATNNVYINSNDGILYAFNALSSFINARITINPYGGSSPTINNGVVYVVSGGPFTLSKIYAIDIATNTITWVYTSKEAYIRGSPIVYNNLLYIGDNDVSGWSNGHLIGIDIHAGTKKWSSVSKMRFDYASPTICNGVIYVLGDDEMYNSYLLAIDAVSGVDKWRYPIKDYSGSNPCVVTADGTVYHPGVSGDQP